MKNITKVVSRIFNQKVGAEFKEWRKSVKAKSFNHNPYGIHGIGHTERVLVHALNLSNVLGLPEHEKEILAKSAIYHDIGRIHDYEDEEHGYYAVLMMQNNHTDAVRGMSKEARNILNYIIEQHCVEDTKAYGNVRAYDIKDRDRAIYLLKVFKDADGLERVRLGDLDVSYLRNEPSKNMVDKAQKLLEAYYR